MSLASALASQYPGLKKELRMARIKKRPEEFIRDALKTAFFMALGLIILLFFYFDSIGGPVALLPLIFVGLAYLLFQFNMIKSKAAVIKKQKEIDKDVLFAGRYLLVKLNSGRPLVSALSDASKSYGVASNYFKEIVKDIELGKPLEKALSDESENSPSPKFRKILFQISNALSIGIDVTEFLEATLNDIADEQLIEINRYGKKLNSVTLFYMLLAVVVPSLGLTIFTVVATLAGIEVNMTFFMVILLFLIILQSIFLVVYKSIRPNINI